MKTTYHTPASWKVKNTWESNEYTLWDADGNYTNDYRDIEEIYYSNAIKFLAENDASLGGSLQLAIDMGYEIKNLNSEVLATLLLQQKLSEELAEIDLSSCFTESEDEGGGVV